jgi:hypothetical protein
MRWVLSNLTSNGALSVVLAPLMLTAGATLPLAPALKTSTLSTGVNADDKLATTRRPAESKAVPSGVSSLVLSPLIVAAGRALFAAVAA